MEKVLHLVFLPVPLMGHLASMVELAKLLLQHPSSDHQIAITILMIQPIVPIPQLPSYRATVSSTNPGISFLDLPSVEVRNTAPGPIFFSLPELVKPHVRSSLQALLSSSSTPIAALVLDFFCTSLIDVANELKIPPYVYQTSGAGILGLFFYLPTLDANSPPDKDLGEAHEEGYTIDLPGFSSPLPPLSLPQELFRRNDHSYSFLVNMGRKFREAKGIISNTFAELQPHAMTAFEQGLYTSGNPTPPIYTVGPVLSLEPKLPEAEQHECIQWLNNQPPSSVVFLCFGSMGSFEQAQAREISVALERSGHRFLWVLRSRAPPPPPTAEGQQQKPPVRVPVDADLEEMLPSGFLERTRDRGLVWPKFAPQAEILSHEAVGGFVTHCGWNSCLESLWFGVPMVGWPLYAEQHFNALEMDSEMGVAVALDVDRKAGNWATAEEVERGVRILMENEEEKGRKVREKALEMKEKGRRALEDGGSSFLSLTRWVADMVQGLQAVP